MGCEQSSETKSGLKVSPPSSPLSIKKFGKPFRKSNSSISSIKAELREMAVGASVEGIRSLLDDYVRSEERIQALEQSDPLTLFYVKKSQLAQIEMTIKEKLSVVQAQPVTKLSPSAEGRSPTPVTVRALLLRFGQKRLTKEDHEVIAKINKTEIVMTELEMLHQEKVLHENDVAELLITLSRLKDEYRNQDDILEELGLGDTGEETGFEVELMELESWRICISETLERWKEARTQVLEASQQFSNILRKMADGKPDQVESEYEVGEELRDGLVTISQALHNVRFYVGPDLPYCTPAELLTLERAMTYLFIDLKGAERRAHAETCYAAFHKRTLALLAWIHKTIETVIMPALNEKTEEIYWKAKELSLVRINSIQKKFPSLNWDKIEKIGEQAPPVQKAGSRRKSNTELLNLLDPQSRRLFLELELGHLARVRNRADLFEWGENYSDTETLSLGSDLRTDSSERRIRRESRRDSIHTLNSLINLKEAPSSPSELPLTQAQT